MKKKLYYLLPFIVTPVLILICNALNSWKLLTMSPYIMGGVLLIASSIFGFFTSTNRKFDYLMTFIMPLSFFCFCFFIGFIGKGSGGRFTLHTAVNTTRQIDCIIIYCLMALVTFLASFKGFRNFKNRIKGTMASSDSKIKSFKICSIIATVIGTSILIFSIVVPIILLNLHSNQDANIAIIGGADAPTMSLFWQLMFSGDSFNRIVFGTTLLLIGVLSLIFRKSIFSNCSLKTSAIALFTSFLGGAGLTCLVIWFSIVSFGKMSKHPIAYPVSIDVGLLSLLAFIISIIFYVKVRKTILNKKGIIIDVLTTIITLPCFFVFCLNISTLI